MLRERLKIADDQAWTPTTDQVAEYVAALDVQGLKLLREIALDLDVSVVEHMEQPPGLACLAHGLPGGGDRRCGGDQPLIEAAGCGQRLRRVQVLQVAGHCHDLYAACLEMLPGLVQLRLLARGEGHLRTHLP